MFIVSTIMRKIMLYFIGNDRVSFDVEKIIIIRWNCKDSHGLTYVEIELTESFEEHLYFTDDNDFELINNLRKVLGFKPLSRVK